MLTMLKTGGFALLAFACGLALCAQAPNARQLFGGEAMAGTKKPDLSRIYGKIQYVDAFPDYKIEVVTAFPDLKVQEVGSFPDAPGKWQIVTSFPDYKIQKVSSFGDFKVQYVTSFPGVAK